MSKATLLLFAVLPACVQSQEISIKTLLPEMTDLARLAKRASPTYKAAQASSYDRASKDPRTNWFANGDAGQFLRVDEREGRKEFVMAELHGPGVVTRIWSANPDGVVRFYFDGEATPRIAVPLADLLTGKVEPFGSPFAYESSQGTNLYFPIPYQQHLTMTVDDSLGGNAKALYYHVGYRSYSQSTPVKTYTKEQVSASKGLMEQVAKTLENPDERALPKLKSIKETMNLVPGQAQVIDLPEEPTAVYELLIRFGSKGGIVSNDKEPWGSPLQLHNALRKTIFMAQFDEDQSINVPLGDFFGTAPGITPYKTYPMEIQKDGTMICRYVMPYKESGALSFVNEGGTPVSLEVEVKTAPYKFDETTYHFKAQWQVDTGKSQPHRDISFLDAKGEGLWLGSSMHVSNPTPAWWGEGDEKVYVDGEEFPSTFGTGTEDYYGYAWCSPTPFQRPYHSQPRCDGPANFGNTSVNRWHIFDPIPYKTALRFDMELWHWADVVATYARTAYWYASPGGTEPVDPNRSLLLPPYIEPPKPIAGAIEGEKMKIDTKTGGTADSQGFWDLSSGAQLWWRHMKAGDRLILKFDVPSAGTYDVIGNFCMAKDYGIHAIKINGQAIEPIDFYNDALTWSKRSIGLFELRAGEATLEITCQGSREGALPGNMFGLDYLLLEKR